MCTPNYSLIPWGPDMLGGLCGSMNLTYNQGLMDTMARSTFWQMPNFSASLSLYPSTTDSMSFLLDPNYAMRQVAYMNNSMQGSILPGFNNGMYNNNLLPGFNGVGSLWNSPWATPPSTPSNNSNNTNMTDAEREMDKENKRIEELLNKFADTLESEDKEDLLNKIKAIKEKKGATVASKNEELKKLFDANKEDLKNYLTSAQCILEVPGATGSGTAKTLTVILDKIGYERSERNSTIKAQDISALHRALNSVNKTNGEISSSSIIAANIKVSNVVDVLDVLSQYNSTYSPESLPELVAKKYKDIASEDENLKEDVYSFAENLKTELTNEANKIAQEIDNIQGKSKFEGLISSLNKLTVKDTAYAEKFNELYVMVRLLTARNLGGKLAKKYGSISSEIFNENMFMSETERDLKNEFKNNKSIVNNAINKASKIKLKDANSGRNIPKTAQEKVDDQSSQGRLHDTGNKTSDNLTIYETTEVINTPDDENEPSKRLYVVKEDKVYEVTKNEDDTYTVGNTPVNIDKIGTAVQEIKDEKTQAEETAREEEKSAVENVVGNVTALDKKIKINGKEYTVYEHEENDVKTYYVYGKDSQGKMSVFRLKDVDITGSTVSGAVDETVTKKSLAQKIGGWFKDLFNGDLDEIHNTQINSKLEHVDEDNVIDLMDSYYGDEEFTKWDNYWNKGFITQLDKASNSGVTNPVTMENKKRVINSILARAKTLQMCDDTDYLILDKLMDKYETEEYRDYTDFENNKINPGVRLLEACGAGCGAGAALGGIIGGIVGFFCKGKSKQFAKWGASIGAAIGGIASGWVQAKHQSHDNNVIDTHLDNLYRKIKRDPRCKNSL